MSILVNRDTCLLVQGVTGRAVECGQVPVRLWNPRDFADDAHRTVDDRPYGGGPGMVMMVDPLRRALQAATVAAPDSRVVYLSPQGRRFDQAAAADMAGLSGLVLLAAAFYLFLRRVFIPQVRYISLANDFFPLFLIMGIAFTGIFMRYFAKVDVTAAKELSYGLVSFSLPSLAKMQEIGSIFYIHVFFVSVLLIYFPWSKLMHMGGVFLSPTRNMPNDNRKRRHVNPIDPEVEVHTYAQWEEEFKDKLEMRDNPLDKHCDK